MTGLKIECKTTKSGKSVRVLKKMGRAWKVIKSFGKIADAEEFARKERLHMLAEGGER